MTGIVGVYLFITPTPQHVHAQKYVWGGQPLLHSASGQAADEVALEAEEDQQRNREADERSGGYLLPTFTVGAKQREQCVGQNWSFAADEDEGDQVIVPNPEELEDGKGCKGWY
jgi:hypothetical protein